MFSVDKQLNYGRSIILNYSKQLEYQSILDIDAGQGIDLNIFTNQHQLIKTFAVDNWSSNIEILEPKGHVVSGLNKEKEKLPFDGNSMDAIIFNQMLEHTKNIFSRYEISDFSGSSFYLFSLFIAKRLSRIFPTFFMSLFFRLTKLSKYNDEFIKSPTIENLAKNYFVGK